MLLREKKKAKKNTHLLGRYRQMQSLATDINQLIYYYQVLFGSVPVQILGNHDFSVP